VAVRQELTQRGDDVAELVRPHGCEALRPRLLEGEERLAEISRAASLPQVAIASREFGDLLMLGLGAFTPLEGFMTRADWLSVCRDYCLASGLFWPIPITLSTNETTAAGLAEGDEVALTDAQFAVPLATMRIDELYKIDKALECEAVFQTADPRHPGVQKVLEQGPINLAGPVKVLTRGPFPRLYPGIFLSPAETRAIFKARGWTTVAAFQTRNPMHRSHEYLVKIALEICDGVLIHSLLGKLKDGDVPPAVSTQAISVLIQHYFAQGSVLQAGYPLDMRYAGPREALLHALFRQNYGCSHLIVGRDHAGVGTYYGPFAAQEIFDEIPRGALEIAPLKIDWTFWCYRCGGMASDRTCPHHQGDRLVLSGTRLRQALFDGAEVPPEFSRPEVLQVLRKYYSIEAAAAQTGRTFLGSLL
jgi:sulfate adenylyltransferase